MKEPTEVEVLRVGRRIRWRNYWGIILSVRFGAAFVSDGEVRVPETFHSPFASLFASFLQGFPLEGEPYTFSLRLNSGVRFKEGWFEGVRYILVRFSSGNPDVFDAVIDGLIRLKDRWESLSVGTGNFRIGDITVEPDKGPKGTLFTLSPVVLEREGNFILPESEDFVRTLRDTMAVRMRLLEGKEPQRFSVKMLEYEVVEVPSLRGKAKGFVGRLRLLADGESVRFAYDYGLGSRTTDGFGMLDVI